MLKLTVVFVFFILAAAGPALAAEKDEKLRPETLLPAFIPVERPAQADLTARLREKVKTLKLNGIPGKNGKKVSRALLLLPRDRGAAGVINFEIEGGRHPGVYQCEALGRGQTSTGPKPRWVSGLIGGATIYYAPKEMADGATVPGVYDLRNISPERYELVFLDKPAALEGEKDLVARIQQSGAKPFFSAVWTNWYPKGYAGMPVDMLWAADSQAGTQGAGVPVFALPPQAASQDAVTLRIKQLTHNPGYYKGPYGRTGFAVHTDRWEEPEKAADPELSQRPELKDFRWRDTDGCVKLRPGCLELLNEFISSEENLGRRVQLEVFETPLLDGIPAASPADTGVSR